MSSIQLQKYIERNLSTWSEYQSLPESSLLRLTLLRKFYQDLHAEKSRCLATGLKTEAALITDWEKRLEVMRNLSNLNLEFETVFMNGYLRNQSSLHQKKRTLTESFLRTLEKAGVQREKFLRIDREWEHAIAAEAFSSGWNFWVLEASVLVNQIEDWNRALFDKLWPRGIVLFAEAAQRNHSLFQVETSWRGRWMILLHPNYHSPLDIPVKLNDLPGYSTDSDSISHCWQLVYSPTETRAIL